MNRIKELENYYDSNYIEENSCNPVILQSNADETRRISDPIHKFIELPKSIWRIVDTPEFQRLRYIKQLGITGFVFNGANHTRFEHCLGVAHLAWTYLDVIAKNHQYKYSQMELEGESHFNKIKLLTTIAGLCHDLGHGPFSHMFDNILLPRLGEKEWKHEQGSCMMLKSILLSDEKDFKSNLISYKDATLYPEKDINVLLDMIEGLTEDQWKNKYDSEINKYPKWVFDIISNKTTSIDVDKFDYLKRDPSGLNVKHEYDWNILFNETRIINGNICYNSKIHDMIYDIFHIRYKLFKHIYLHRVTQGIELMLCDALEKASVKIPFKEIIRNPQMYLRLTDSIIEQILMTDDEQYQELKESKEIINRIYSRQLYKFVGEIIVPQDASLTDSQIIDGISRFNEQLIGFNPKSQRLTDDEKKNVVVTISKINYCMSDRDPVDFVYFFKSSKPNEKKKLNAQNSSLLRPQKFGEKIVRVYVKEDNDQLINRVKNGFSNYTQKELNKEQGDYDKKETSKTPFKYESEKRVKKSPYQELSQSGNSQNFFTGLSNSKFDSTLKGKQIFSSDEDDNQS